MFNCVQIVFCKFVILNIIFIGLLNFPDVIPEYLEIMKYGNDDQMVLNAGENLTLICRGNERLKWKSYVFNEENNERGVRFHENEEIYFMDQDYIYSELIISKASYLDTGEYWCCDNDFNCSHTIYVFVNDEHHIFLPHIKDESSAIQLEEFTIPCRTTSPSTIVELQRNGLVVPNVQGSYDPKKGFTVFLNETWKDSTSFTCIGSNKNRTERYTIDVIEDNILTRIPWINTSVKKYFAGSQLKLSCRMFLHPLDLTYLAWKLPSTVHPSDSRLQRKNNTLLWIRNGRLKNTIETMLLSNLTIDDSGTYACEVMDQFTNHLKKKTIDILVEDKPYIHLKSVRNSQRIFTKLGRNVLFHVEVDANPLVFKYEWFFNNNTITTNLHYEVKVKNISAAWEFELTPCTSLLIKRVSTADAGQYTLRATNQYGFESINFTLEVDYKPYVSIFGPSHILLGHGHQFKCTAVRDPVPDIRWYFKKCSPNHNCSTEPLSDDALGEKRENFKVTSSLTLNQNVSGTLYCEASNADGKGLDFKEVSIFDIPGEDRTFNAWKDIDMVYAGESIILHCGASKYNFSGSLEWYLNSNETPLTSNDGFQIIDSSTDYSYQKNIKISNASKDHNGLYRCKNGLQRSSLVELTILDSKLPVIVDSNLQGGVIKVDAGKDFRFYCRGSGVPNVTMTWKKNNTLWIPDLKRIKVSENNQTVDFVAIINEDGGRYSCEVSNRIGTQVNSTVLKINVIRQRTWATIIIVTSIFITNLIIAIKLFFIKLQNEKRRIAELENVGLHHFDVGNVESINPNIAIGEQADLLPYDNEWEFPREKLKLGIVLGSGEFGIVMKAEAHGITAGEESTTVAVKTIKKNADIIHVKALVSELKIMCHLGCHVNIANLLGACTKNLVNKRELYIIVEYCRFGSLLYYLQRHRGDFVNQIDPSTGDIIGQNVNALNNRTTDQAVNYSYISPLCSQDLLCWAFQIARGMEYLVSRRVLHGDLAARNVLVADHNIVKICDFGLAKSIYNDPNYVRKNNCPLPVKWMALESIRDRIFSVQSDIWSYGVVLWELFSLGQAPYSEIISFDNFVQQLDDGYRLNKPDFATTKLHQMMLRCWQKDPKNRPLFDELANEVGEMLSDGVREHYINLNGPYLAMNSIKSKQHSDYLTMMNLPVYENFVSSTPCINQFTTATQPEACDGNNPICMQPESAAINLNDWKKTEKSSRDATSFEMIPMWSLNIASSTTSENGPDAEITTPEVKNISMDKFLNPRYEISNE